MHTDGGMVTKGMAVERRYASDIKAILSHRYDQGGDLWTTSEKRLIKGAPFSTLESMTYLFELDMKPDDAALKDATELVFSTWQEDGRFKLYPNGSIFPCQTIHAANVMPRLGYAPNAKRQRALATARYPAWRRRLALPIHSGSAIIRPRERALAGTVEDSGCWSL